jgi:hypothetical protein
VHHGHRRPRPGGCEQSSLSRRIGAAGRQPHSCRTTTRVPLGTTTTSSSCDLPKGTDLGFYRPGMLDSIAAELNARPRKRHGFQTPAEELDRLLSKAATNRGVA